MSPSRAVHLLLTLSCIKYLPTASCAARIDQTILRRLEKFPTVTVLIQFGAHHISRAIDEHRRRRSKDLGDKLTEPQVTAYIENLIRISSEYQASVLAYLQIGSCGANYPEEACRNIEYFQLWISNEISIQNADKALIHRLASMPNVTEILSDVSIVTNLCGSSPKPKPPSPQTTTDPPYHVPDVGFNLDMLQVKKLWDKGITGQGAIVGIIDSGVSIEHPTVLKGNFRGEYGWIDASYQNFTSPVDIDTEHSHGTCVLSLAVGRADDDGTPIGVAPGAKWMACKHSIPAGGLVGFLSKKCMTWMACPTLPDGSNRDCSKRPDVVNHSFGDFYITTLEKNYFDVYEAVNVLIVQAAGNQGPECETLAAESELDWPISVGDVDYSRKVVPMSSRGPARDGRVRPHLVAPGDSAYCLMAEKWHDLWFMYGAGTSAAAPHVTGMVALIKSYKPELTAAQLKSVVIRGSWSNHSREIGAECGNRTAMSTPNNLYGYGISNAYEAYCLAKKNKFLPIDELLDWGIQKYESPCD